MRATYVFGPDGARQSVLNVVREAIASVSVPNSSIDATGPKTSSWASRESVSTPENTVGRKNQSPSFDFSAGVAAVLQRRALLASEVGVLRDLLELGLRRERTHLGRGVFRVAQTYLASALDEPVDEPVSEPPVNETS